MYYIYKITCTITNKNYIGKSTIPVSKRWNRHLRDSQKLDTHLARAMKLYGTENFFIEEIDSCEEDLNLLNEKERFWISHYDSYHNGYNETEGGDGGNTYGNKTSEEMEIIKEKIRQTKLGGNNPQAKAIKCKSIKTGEELTFNSLAECRDYFQETNHQFISRRILGNVKSLWKQEWAFAYLNEDYQHFTSEVKNNNSVSILVEDLIEETEPMEFISFSAAERYFNQPQKSFAQSRQKDKKATTYIVKNRYKIQVLK